MMSDKNNDDECIHEITLDEMSADEIKDYVSDLKNFIHTLEMMPYMKEDDLDEAKNEIERLRRELAKETDENATNILYKEKLQQMLNIDFSGSDTNGNWDDVIRAIEETKQIVGNSIYFNDSSKYLPDLYSVFERLGGNSNSIHDLNKLSANPNCEICHGKYYLPSPPGVNVDPPLECPACKWQLINRRSRESAKKSDKTTNDIQEVERLKLIIADAVTEATNEFLNDQRVMDVVKDVYGITDDVLISQKNMLKILQRVTVKQEND